MLPELSVAAAGALLQNTDKLFKTVPEMDTVLGKARRTKTATDPAPIEMLDTTHRRTLYESGY
jgi:Cu(I)/Ag(I) efflux system membrane protein CusA/SilA